ncbi:tetratricopeptide repeat protein [bacterium]|nr:tetratricopeptide repeat protein [bacterium]
MFKKINIWVVLGVIGLCYLFVIFRGKNSKFKINKKIEKLSEVSKKIEDIDEIVGMKYIMANVFRDKLNDYEKACQKLSEILDQYPENILTDAVMFELGETYHLMGNDEISKKYFNNVVSTYPETISARKALEKLELITGKEE